MPGVETAEGGGRGTFDYLAKRSGFTPAECRLAAETGRLGAIIGVMRARDANRARMQASWPEVPPVLSGREALLRLRMKRRPR